MISQHVTPWLANVALAAALVLTPLVALAPTPAQAVIDSPSADPSEEIVYTDSNEVIRILDFQGAPQLNWFSPTAGWRDIALGDVNADGDLEIIGLGRVDASTVKIAVFDPVASFGGIKDPERNNIPWAILYETTFPGSPSVIDAGNFDPGIEGDEILYGYREPGGVSHIVILNAAKLEANGKPSGRDWKVHIDKSDFANSWTYAAHGQIVEGGAEEVILVDGRGVMTDDGVMTRFDVFNLDAGFSRVDGKNSSSDTLDKVAVGQVIAGGADEIVEVRSSDPGKQTVRVYKWDAGAGELKGAAGWVIIPNPDFPFLADVTGNGDKEIFVLRGYRKGEKGSRLFMFDEWGSDSDARPADCDNYDEELDSCELFLDNDNGYQLGVGGDVDGDGGDEIIIIRDNNIRIYKEPHRSMGSGTIANYALNTSKDALEAGDLDKNGFVEGPVIATDKERVEASVPTGTQSTPVAVRLTNSAGSEAFPFSAFTDQFWARVTPNSGMVPATLSVSFDASGLSVGVYHAQLTIVSGQANVVNDPFVIELVLTVEPAALQASPANVALIYAPCDPATIISDTTGLTRTTEVLVGGTAGLRFNAAVVEVPLASAASMQVSQVDAAGNLVLTDGAGGAHTIPATSLTASAVTSGTIVWPEEVPWIVEATSVTNTVPATVALTVDPSVLGDQFTAANAVLVFVADVRAGTPPRSVTTTPILAMCASNQSRLPVVAR